ncbi:dTDP-glucose 4,6-dehydratase [Candidatus Uabimicrobium amorphum]|uniref:dTDP-glucose 4,6-dehydratase n=1 Tax=Uabimicrobium amorphum TaxID=2596890 RepID=A0A5S9F442_UABAM|nr:dTDP-glucose 4,6-dehydratase [Candidatus Uabimicrobium amorphum]BBM85415.1 dTDP-glucose 4,6-dehydratase [Candidatus Uabimicrobium amorphum]
MTRHNILVTGGAGFIGCNFIRYIFENTDFAGRIINIDKLTYAGNQNHLSDIAAKYPQRYFFKHHDICDYQMVKDVFQKYQIDTVVHFAAESHVDRSIYGPKNFIETNIVGTSILLEIAREIWAERQDVLFHHVSTDEVYGSLGDKGYFYETTAYNPRNPYSASKAASDHLVNAYFHTYKLPITLSNCSNNFGPYQFPEKLIPVVINCIKTGKNIPVYGQGKNVRDWLYVEDHCSAIWAILQRGKRGETYNVGGENEWQNIQLVELLCETVAKIEKKNKDAYKNLITFVTDRKGHDLRYAVNCDKLKSELGWSQQHDFITAIDKTVRWYLQK